jgi:hypothetical protein
MFHHISIAKSSLQLLIMAINLPAKHREIFLTIKMTERQVEEKRHKSFKFPKMEATNQTVDFHNLHHIYVL